MESKGRRRVVGKGLPELKASRRLILRSRGHLWNERKEGVGFTSSTQMLMSIH